MDKNIYSSEFKWAVVKGKNEAILTLTERKTHKEILVKSDDKNLKTLWSSFFFRFGCANYLCREMVQSTPKQNTWVPNTR